MEQVQSNYVISELYIKEELLDESWIDNNGDIDPLGEESSENIEDPLGLTLKQEDCRDENTITVPEAASSVSLIAGFKIEELQYTQADNILLITSQDNNLSNNAIVSSEINKSKESATTYLHNVDEETQPIKGSFQLKNVDFVFEFTSVVSSTKSNSACTKKTKTLNNCSKVQLIPCKTEKEHELNANVIIDIDKLIEEENNVKLIHVDSESSGTESDCVIIVDSVQSKEIVNKAVTSLNKEIHSNSNKQRRQPRKRKQDFITKEKDEHCDQKVNLSDTRFLNKIPDNCCPKCYTFVDNKSQLEKHTKEKHLQRKRVHKHGIRKHYCHKLMCDMCYSVFESTTNRKIHTAEFKCMEIKQCKFCDVTFETRKQYEQHYLDCHSNEHFCAFCDYAFSNRMVKVKRHYYVHTSSRVKLLFCFHCKGRFNTQIQLNNHKCCAAKELLCEKCYFSFKNFIEHDEHIDTCHLRRSAAKIC